MISSEAPWRAFYGNVPFTLDYPDCSMFDAVEQNVEKYPDYVSLEFMGGKITYSQLHERVHKCARALRAAGIKPGDRVTVCLPNLPQGVAMFYAINLIGAVANMIHPLSSENEIAFYIQDSHSVAAVTLDQFYGKFKKIRKKAPLDKLIVTSVGDELGGLMKLGYALTEGRKITPVPRGEPGVVFWKDFLKGGEGWKGEYTEKRYGSDPAAILYSGGTTGKTKGILLSNLNFNALAMQTAAMGNGFLPGDTMLALMPIFHGFGLGVCIHTVQVAGGCSILIPRFNAKTYAQTLKKMKPNYIAGVPTLYEFLLRNPHMDGVDLSFMKGVFSGGDSLSIELKKKFDKFLTEHGAKIQMREGYGTTECVTASCLTPNTLAKEGSIGIPFPDTFYKIVKPGTTEEAPAGQEGEICISGPTVMVEYVGQPEETADTLRRHEDGKVWLHTGDLGMMDEDGFVYFRQRIKRMIVSSGYSIYPSQLENVIDAHPMVSMSCVLGVPDPIKVQKVKAFVVLKSGVASTPALKEELFAYCRRNIAKYAMPYDIEIRESLPQTLVGKVAYTELEKEELAAMEEDGEPRPAAAT